MRSPSTTSSSSSSRAAAASGGRSDAPATVTPCCGKVELKRGPWTAEEDELLASYVKKEGEGRWRTLPKKAGLLRCGKSCRLRWMNYLRPSVKRGRFSPDEEDLILRLHRLLGNRWSLIAGRIPGRTDNEIKNYWNTHLSKKLLTQGIDPKTHKPIFPNPNHHHQPTNRLLHNSSDHHQPFHSPDHYVPFPVFQSVPAAQLGHVYGEGTVAASNKLMEVASRNCDEGIITSNEDDDMKINGSHQDDAFLSFLNSLINDGTFNLHQDHPQHDRPT